MMMKISYRRFGVGAGVLLALVMGTASSAQARHVTAPVSAGPPVPIKVSQLDLNGFFPSVTRIHLGDKVSFSINGFHTVSFLAKGQAPPPLIIPSSIPISGNLDAAGAPFWFNGQPRQMINPAIAAPSGSRTYKGSGYLNSGLPAPSGPPAPFVVKFTKRGTFTFNCLVHHGMKGVIQVVGKSRTVPAAAQDRTKAAEDAAAAVVQARELAKVKPPAATVLAGNDDGGPVTWLRFFPAHLTVKAGTAVNFESASPRQAHTITFGPAPYTKAIENTFTTPLNNAAGPPTLLVNPQGGYPSDPPPLPPYTGKNHGNGYEGSGLLALGGPLPSSVKITFSTPGVYSFECVLHPGMDGKITVTK
jgi:plastocyanin